MLNRFVLLTIFSFLFFPAFGYADVGMSSCDNQSANIGSRITEYIYCGVDFTNQKSTLFGILSLYIHCALLVYFMVVIGMRSFLYLKDTMQQRENSEEIKSSATTVVKLAAIFFLLVPIISNGFSASQVLVKNNILMGSMIADEGSASGASFLDTQSIVGDYSPVGLINVTSAIYEAELCSAMTRIYHDPDYQNGLVENRSGEVIVLTRSIESDHLQLSWDYVDPGAADYSFWSKSKSQKGFCGAIRIGLPKVISDDLADNPSTRRSITESSVSMGGSYKGASEYNAILNSNYNAVTKHILEIKYHVNDLVADLRRSSAISSIKALGAGNVNQIEAEYDKLEGEKLTALNAMTNASNRAKSLHNTFQNDVKNVGNNAAQRLASLDETVMCFADLRCTGEGTWKSQLEQQGWIAVGGFHALKAKNFYRLYSAQQSNIGISNRTLLSGNSSNVESSIASDIMNSETYELLHRRYREISAKLLQSNHTSYVTADSNLNTNSKEGYSTTSGEDGGGIFTGAISALSSLGNSLTPLTLGKLTNNDGQDLLTKLIGVGQSYIWWGLAILAAYGVLYTIAKFTTGNIVGKIVGADGMTGSDAPVGRIFSALFWLGVALLVFGLVLTIALPTIVSIKWALEVFSWSILQILALVYAPIWVAAHAHAADERFMTENTISGYGLSIECILRPSLTTFSYFGFYLLLQSASLILIATGLVFDGILENSNFIVGILSNIFVPFFVTYFGYQLVIRCFDLISVLTDAILTRASFGTKPLGDAANENTSSNLAMFLYKPNNLAAARTFQSIFNKKD